MHAAGPGQQHVSLCNREPPEQSHSQDRHGTRRCPGVHKLHKYAKNMPRRPLLLLLGVVVAALACQAGRTDWLEQGVLAPSVPTLAEHPALCLSGGTRCSHL